MSVFREPLSYKRCLVVGKEKKTFYCTNLCSDFLKKQTHVFIIITLFTSFVGVEVYFDNCLKIVKELPVTGFKTDLTHRSEQTTQFMIPFP